MTIETKNVRVQGEREEEDVMGSTTSLRINLEISALVKIMLIRIKSKFNSETNTIIKKNTILNRK